jgi:hypothetical protein
MWNLSIPLGTRRLSEGAGPPEARPPSAFSVSAQVIRADFISQAFRADILNHSLSLRPVNEV